MPRCVIYSITLMYFVATTCAHAASPADWVKAADAIRNPAESYEMSIKVETPEGDSVFDVYLKGQSHTMIRTKEPVRDRGRNMLMSDRDFYAYVPNLKRAVRLSLSQKLSGQVSNGDIARTRWAGDYQVTQESPSPSTQEVQLLLNGQKDGLTYQKIRLWLDSSSHRPLRAEYLSLDGKSVLKKAWFEEYTQLAGSQRPSVIRIQDNAGKTSKIKIQKMQPKEFADSLFTERGLE